MNIQKGTNVIPMSINDNIHLLFNKIQKIIWITIVPSPNLLSRMLDMIQK